MYFNIPRLFHEDRFLVQINLNLPKQYQFPYTVSKYKIHNNKKMMIDKYQFLDAAKSGDTKVIEAYLVEEQNINVVDDRPGSLAETALIYAAKNNHTKIVKMLTEYPLDTGIIDKNLNSALHYTINNKNLKNFRLIAESTKNWDSYAVGDKTVPYDYFNEILKNNFIENDYEPIKILLKRRYDVESNADVDLIFSHCLKEQNRILIDLLICQSSYKFMVNSEHAITDLGDSNDGINFYKIDEESINKMALKIEIVEDNIYQNKKSAEAFVINSLSNIVSSLIAHKKLMDNLTTTSTSSLDASPIDISDLKSNFVALNTLASILIESKYFDPRIMDSSVNDEYKFDDDDQFDREHDDEVYFNKDEAIQNLLIICQSYDNFFQKILKQIRVKQSQLYAIEFLGNYLDKYSNGFKKRNYKNLLDDLSKLDKSARLDILVKNYKYLNPYNKRRLNTIEVIYYVNEYLDSVINEYFELKQSYRKHSDKMFKNMFDENLVDDTFYFVRERFK